MLLHEREDGRAILQRATRLNARCLCPCNAIAVMITVAKWDLAVMMTSWDEFLMSLLYSSILNNTRFIRRIAIRRPEMK